MGFLEGLSAGGTPVALPGILMIRITVTPTEVGTRVKIDGGLVTEDVREVDAACGSAAVPVVLDLADLKTIDSVGVVCLLRLMSGGATVEAAPPYIRMRLGLGVT
jgi:hypothetical protein